MSSIFAHYSSVCNSTIFQCIYACSLLIIILLSLSTIGQKDGDLEKT